MNVSLTPKLEKIVHKKVKSGMYNSASEVIREALRLLYEYDRIREQQLSIVREQVLKGVEQLDSGKSSTFDSKAVQRIRDQGRKRLGSSKKA